MFPFCQFKVGTETPEALVTRRQCRAMPTFEVAETVMSGNVARGFPEERGWFGLGDFCTGHAITVTAAKPTRAMRPLAATVEVHGKR